MSRLPTHHCAVFTTRSIASMDSQLDCHTPETLTVVSPSLRQKSVSSRRLWPSPGAGKAGKGENSTSTRKCLCLENLAPSQRDHHPSSGNACVPHRSENKGYLAMGLRRDRGVTPSYELSVEFAGGLCAYLPPWKKKKAGRQVSRSRACAGGRCTEARFTAKLL